MSDNNDLVKLNVCVGLLTVCTELHDGDDGLCYDFVYAAMKCMAGQLHRVYYINHLKDILVDRPLRLHGWQQIGTEMSETSTFLFTKKLNKKVNSPIRVTYGNFKISKLSTVQASSNRAAGKPI